MSEDAIDLTWSLGDNLDCELCGSTWNEVGLELWDEEEGIWQLYIRVGCYEGDSVMSNDPEWDKKSAEIVEQATWYSGFSEDNLKELRGRLALIRGGERMNKVLLLEKWHKQKGLEPWSIDDIAELVAEASNIGEEIGERMERERIIALLKEHQSEMKGDFVESVEHNYFLQGFEEAISIIQLASFLGEK